MVPRWVTYRRGCCVDENSTGDVPQQYGFRCAEKMKVTFDICGPALSKLAISGVHIEKQADLPCPICLLIGRRGQKSLRTRSMPGFQSVPG